MENLHNKKLKIFRKKLKIKRCASVHSGSEHGERAVLDPPLGFFGLALGSLTPSTRPQRACLDSVFNLQGQLAVCDILALLVCYMRSSSKNSDRQRLDAI